MKFPSRGKWVPNKRVDENWDFLTTFILIFDDLLVLDYGEIGKFIQRIVRTRTQSLFIEVGGIEHQISIEFVSKFPPEMLHDSLNLGMSS